MDTGDHPGTCLANSRHITMAENPLPIMTELCKVCVFAVPPTPILSASPFVTGNL